MRKLLEKPKQLYNHINDNVAEYMLLVFIIASLWLPDLLIRYMVSKSTSLYYNWVELAPNLFTLSYILSFLLIFIMLSYKFKRIWLILGLFISNLLFNAQYFHFKTFDKFLSFSDLFLAGEGKDFILDVIPLIGKRFAFAFVLLTSIQIVTYIIFTKVKPKELTKTSVYIFGFTVLTFIRIFANLSLGEMALSDSFEASYYPRNIYVDFLDNNKSYQLSGMYEFMFKSTKIFIEKNFSLNLYQKRMEVDNYFNMREDIESNNEMSGVFKNKNLIYILLESVDEWAITPETMPTLNMMKETGWNFSNRFAPAYGGGWTFNSEFAANTGNYSVENYKAAYTFDNNNYKYSLPTMFLSEGYSVNSIHVNWGSFYNRSNIHESIGYERHFSLAEMHEELNENLYELYNDEILLDNNLIYNMFISNEQKFMTHYTSYSGHLPYDKTNDLCANMDQIQNGATTEEEKCYFISIKSLDVFLSKLLKSLEADNLLDETVIILYGDHYAYGFTDENYIYVNKNTNDSNLLQKVPFIIWNKDISAKEFEMVFHTSDFVPTIANLFGLGSYDANNYISSDIFSVSHTNYVPFADGNWYDGTYYSDNLPRNIGKKYVEFMNSKTKKYNEINEAILITDYFNY